MTDEEMKVRIDKAAKKLAEKEIQRRVAEEVTSQIAFLHTTYMEELERKSYSFQSAIKELSEVKAENERIKLLREDASEINKKIRRITGDQQVIDLFDDLAIQLVRKDEKIMQLNKELKSTLEEKIKEHSEMVKMQHLYFEGVSDLRSIISKRIVADMC